MRSKHNKLMNDPNASRNFLRTEKVSLKNTNKPEMKN